MARGRINGEEGKRRLCCIVAAESCPVPLQLSFRLPFVLYCFFVPLLSFARRSLARLGQRVEHDSHEHPVLPLADLRHDFDLDDLRRPVEQRAGQQTHVQKHRGLHARDVDLGGLSGRRRGEGRRERRERGRGEEEERSSKQKGRAEKRMEEEKESSSEEETKK